PFSVWTGSSVLKPYQVNASTRAGFRSNKLPSNLMLSQPGTSRTLPFTEVVSREPVGLVLISSSDSNALAFRGPAFSRSMQTKTPAATPASKMRPPHFSGRSIDAPSPPSKLCGPRKNSQGGVDDLATNS